MFLEVKMTEYYAGKGKTGISVPKKKKKSAAKRAPRAPTSGMISKTAKRLRKSSKKGMKY